MITVAEVLAQMHEASSMRLFCGTTDEIKIKAPILKFDLHALGFPQS
jgi:hypothetical protein